MSFNASYISRGFFGFLKWTEGYWGVNVHFLGKATIVILGI